MMILRNITSSSLHDYPPTRRYSPRHMLQVSGRESGPPSAPHEPPPRVPTAASLMPFAALKGSGGLEPADLGPDPPRPPIHASRAMRPVILSLESGMKLISRLMRLA